MNGGAPVSLRWIRVFISSPSDVVEERAYLRKTLADLPYDPFLRGQIAIEEVSWDRPGAEVPMIASITPQEAIDKGLPRPSECDIVVVVLWSRIGTPLGERYRKPDGQRYLSGTEWEYLDAVTAARGSGRPRVLLYHRDADVSVSLGDPHLDERRKQLQGVGEFLAGRLDADRTFLEAYNSYPDPPSFASLVEGHLRIIIKELLDATTKRDVTGRSANINPSPTPFPGLRPFREDESRIFFGRERETSELIQRLADPQTRGVAVIGASGTGKSSLVTAGLFPGLRAGAIPGASDWRIIRMLPGELGSNPFLALALQIVANLGMTEPDAAASITNELYEEPERFVEYAMRLLVDTKPWVNLVVFIDQFEELFSSIVDATYESAFVALITAGSKSPLIRFVLTLRAEFYARCLEFPELAQLLRAGSFPLGPPGPGSLFRMITRPVEIAGMKFEDGLAERILEDTGSEPGGLALMAFALHQLYQHSDERRILLESEYERLGGIDGAIAIYAEQVFSELVDDDRQYLPKIFRRLADVNELGVTTRCRAKLSSFGDEDVAKRLIKRLTDARLLVVANPDLGEPTVEVAHESLFESWPRLAEWIEQTRDDLRLLRQLRRAAQDWDRSGRQETFLWPHERLSIVDGMLANLDPELDDVVAEFIVPESSRLIEELQGACSHERRAAIGDRLASIGDPRLGTGLDRNGIPEIRWCEIPSGGVLLREHPTPIEVGEFSMAAYNINYTQYQSFLEAKDGYGNPVWWEGLARRPAEPGRQSRRIANHPAENVCWYDAVAFCRWLSSRLGESIRLPTDWEWQLAVAGPGDGRGYAWGPDWNDELANTSETGLARSVAVGLYPGGATSTGVHDLHGNVWEWCLNELSATEGRINLRSDGARVVRGGSWLVVRSFARADFRGWDDPELRYGGCGFRVVRPK